MNHEKKGRTEALVGLFLFLGLGILAVLVVVFGRVGNALSKPYELTVVFSNVSGLASGADVLLGGARVGFISKPPQLMGDSYRVAVQLKIDQAVRIPRKSRFLVGSANLLGDKYIDIAPASDMDPADVWMPGEIIEGSKSSGIEEITARGTEVMEQLSKSLKQVEALTTTLNQRILSETNVKSLEETFANLRDTSAAFKNTALSIDSVMEKAGGALSDIHGVTDRARAAAESIQKLAKNATEGRGALGTLVSDKETAENLKAFIFNMRRSGILFYRDKPLPEKESTGGGR